MLSRPQNGEYGSKGILLEPLNHILKIPGKEIRTRLIQAFNLWLNIPPDVLQRIAEIVKILHVSSLVIDDIEDNSKLRRGVPVAHSIYGLAWSLNSANYAYFQAFEKCSQFRNPEIVSAFVEEMLSLHTGQGYEIFWRDRNVCPTEEAYKKMVQDKTGGLFRLAIRLMQSFSDNKTDYLELVNQLGIFFQIRDDLMNISSPEYEANKGFCEDITEGKFSFPIIHSIQSDPTDHAILHILKTRTEDVDIKKFLIESLKKSGSIDYTVDELKKIKERILKIISDLGGNPEIEEIMNDLKF